MKKTFVVVPLLLALSGCAGKETYLTASGREIKTSEKMAYMMAVRDSNIAKTTATSEAIASSTRPDQVIALLAIQMSGVGQQTINEPKTWDERARPWVRDFLDIWLIARRNGNENSPSQSGTGNTQMVFNDSPINGSNFYPGISTSITQNPNTQVGSEESQNGANTRDESQDNSTTDVIP